MNTETHILVLGAYGLAGRAIVERLVTKTPYNVVAAGRNADKLRALLKKMDNERLQARTLDTTEASALRDACAGASFVINAVGPFARTGAAIAHTVIQSRRPYLDCANEQRHYRHLKNMDALACQQGVPMITAAGAIPGISTLLLARMLKHFPDVTEATCCWAQFRHAYAESGLASMMGGILEAMESPLALSRGRLVPVAVGASNKLFELHEPFGRLRLMELPTIDTLTLSDRFTLQELHTWFYLGDMPTWLLGIIRLLRPDRRGWAYSLIESIMRHLNNRETTKAIDAGIGPECLLTVTVGNGGESKRHFMMFCDGAAATACLPVYIAALFLNGALSQTGLLTPLDIVATEDLAGLTEGVVVSSDCRKTFW